MPPPNALEEQLVTAYQAGDFEAAGKLAKQIRAANAWKRGAERAQLSTDLIENEDPGTLFLAGANRKARDIATLGFGNRAGGEADRLLSESTPGALGEFAVDMATLAPIVKGAQTVGKGMGMLSPMMARSPVATSVASNALTSGGFTGATTPGDIGERGAAGGAAALASIFGDIGTRGLGFAAGGPLRASKAATPGAQSLIDNGVPVPFWKATDNKIIRDLAERGKGMPIARTVIGNAEDTAMDAWNKNLSKAATPPKPILDEGGNVIRWESSSPVTKTGSEGLRELRKRYDDSFDALYRGRVIPVDSVFQTDVNEALRFTQNYLPAASQEVKGVARQVRDLLSPTDMTSQGGKLVQGRAGIDHETFKRALDVVDSAVGEAWRSGQGRKAEALGGIKDALLEMRGRGLPPEVQAAASEVNSAYRNFKILERAGSGVSAQKKGYVVPDQILNAMRALDRSPNKSAFSRGNVQGQGEALDASRVLGNRLPDTGPGTFEKYIMSAAALSPSYWMADLGTTAMAAAAMSPQGQRLMMGQYGFQPGLQAGMNAAAPYVSQGAGLLNPLYNR